MKNEMFMAALTPLCSDDLKANLAVLLTRSAQAICFLENEIKAPLYDDYIAPFTELLSIMENFDDIQLQILAQEIQQCIRANKQKQKPTQCVSGICIKLLTCLEYVNKLNNGSRHSYIVSLQLRYYNPRLTMSLTRQRRSSSK